MERAAFLIESSGERIGCLLNPESVVRRRRAGILPRQSSGGRLTGSNLADDPLLYTGGGQTELCLELLFDVNVAGSTIPTENVQDLTRPLWQLAENSEDFYGLGELPLVRFVWGKSFNMPGVIVAVAERLEQFGLGGAPQRSWLSLRLLRVSEPVERISPFAGIETLAFSPEDLYRQQGGRSNRVRRYETHQGGAELNFADRLDVLAYTYLGAASLWRVLASLNNIDDPVHLSAGITLEIPTANPPESSE
ncbi:MAG: hypothetical protein J0I20_13495 [Chloroflexi bacterium]|nr:hypothetical protein [Chloroflexota bacterium]OJV92839.1 MAG: hypothetical protein BGO39_30255 [Chloroflexi bacterium 54-19]